MKGSKLKRQALSPGVKHEPDVSLCVNRSFAWSGSKSKRSAFLCIVLGCPWSQQRCQFRGVRMHD